MPYSNTTNPNRIPERIDKVIDETQPTSAWQVLS